MGKIKLKLGPVFDSFFEDAGLFGIISSKKQYELCWKINQLLGLNFRLNNDIEAVLSKKDRTCFFPVYEYFEPVKGISHYLYCNNYRGEQLVSDLKHMDYIWLLKGKNKIEEDLKLLIENVRFMEDIQMVSRLKASEIKDCINLIF